MNDSNHVNLKRETHKDESKIQIKWLMKKRLEHIRE